MRTTVVITTYNYGRFVREAVESVQAQGVDDLQIVVVDDGSTDDTPEVLAALRDPRLEVVRTPNRGISAARNEGLARARGRYVAFLDADDRWRPDKLRRQLGVLEGDPSLAAVFSNFVRFDEKGVFPLDQFTFYPELARVPTTPTAAGAGERIEGDAFSTLVSFGEIPAWVQTLLFRAEALRGLAFPEKARVRAGLRYGICEDMHFCLRAFRRGGVAFVRDPLVEVRRHGDNATRDLSDMAHAHLAALRLLAGEPLTRGQRAALRRRTGRAWVGAGLQDAADGRRRLAAAAYLRAAGFAGARLSALKNLALLALPRGLRAA
ncbi:MAG TPA: glycosyltransferase family 2 protein [Longimicrobium sp.]